LPRQRLIFTGAGITYHVDKMTRTATLSGVSFRRTQVSEGEGDVWDGSRRTMARDEGGCWDPKRSGSFVPDVCVCVCVCRCDALFSQRGNESKVDLKQQNRRTMDRDRPGSWPDCLETGGAKMMMMKN
jgi:hypothetical protein